MTIVRATDLDYVDLPGRRSADPFPGQEAESSVRIVDLERTEGRTAHRHPHSEEIVVVGQGTGEVWIDGIRTPVGPGDVVCIPAGAAHATVPDEGVTMRLVCFFPHPDLSQNVEETNQRVS